MSRAVRPPRPQRERSLQSCLIPRLVGHAYQGAEGKNQAPGGERPPPEWYRKAALIGFIDPGVLGNAWPPSPPEQLAHDLGGVVHHGDDAGVVEPGRPDHAEHADDAAGGVVIGRDDGRGTRQREQLVLRADENPDPFGLLGRPNRSITSRRVSRSSNRAAPAPDRRAP